jgi:hypothetical protein
MPGDTQGPVWSEYSAEPVPSIYSDRLVNVDFQPACSMITSMLTLILIGLLRGIRTQRSLVLENLALRHQLVVLQRTVPRPPLCARMDETVPPSEITVEGGKGY